MCSASESTSKQVRDINQADNVHVVRAAKQSLMRSKQETTGSSSRNCDRNALSTISCKFCGKTHIQKKEECPVKGKQGTKCGTRNHFAIKCPQTTRPGAVNTLALVQEKYLEDPPTPLWGNCQHDYCNYSNKRLPRINAAGTSENIIKLRPQLNAAIFLEVAAFIRSIYYTQCKQFKYRSLKTKDNSQSKPVVEIYFSRL